MISFDEAVAIVLDVARPLASETVPLATAARRVLATPVIAGIDSPRTDVSRMDGYAMREQDLARTNRFRVVGTSYPGDQPLAALGEGECVRIFTGAPVPDGADKVVIQENVTSEADVAIVKAAPSPNRFVRTQGSDFHAGEALLDTGRLLDPRAMVAAAAADVAKIAVWRRPRVAILGTGDELAEPGSARDRPGSIPESVSLGVAALAAEWGGDVVARYRVQDELAAVQAQAATALDIADIVIVSGGASVGAKDFAKAAFEALGTRLLFSKVAMMPGKPVWLGITGNRLVLGLPGNPTSAMVTARLFLAPLLAGLGGRDPLVALQWQRVRLAEALGAAGDRETFVRGVRFADGVRPVADQDSGMQRALAQADLLIRRLPNASALDAGAEADVLAF